MGLREVLLEHATALARGAGPDGVTLREVQRRAGVSHNAGYRHFASRDALLSALAAEASVTLADAMRAAADRVGTAPGPDDRARARFRAIGHGYLAFARSEPGLFRTAFEAPADPSAGRDLPGGPYAVLNAALDDLVATGTLDPARRPGTEAAVWASVHGMAMLLIDGPFAALDPRTQDALVERLLEVVDTGVR